MLIISKTLLFKSDTSIASVMDSIKTHDRENIQQMFSTRFFNKGLMVINHMTKPPYLHQVEMATIVTHKGSKTQNTQVLSFDLQPDLDLQRAGKHDFDPRLVLSIISLAWSNIVDEQKTGRPN